MKDVIAQIHHLIALTDSPNENEARNAAMQVCRLIREHEVFLGPKCALDESYIRVLSSGPFYRQQKQESILETVARVATETTIDKLQKTGRYGRKSPFVRKKRV